MHFISSARLISLLTLASRILGLIRDGLMSRVFGATLLHYFYIPFLIPNLSRRIFGEGALSAALIPVYTEQLHKDPKLAKRLAQSVVTLLVIILSALTLVGLGLIGAYWNFFSSQGEKTLLMFNLAAIMLPYMILICTVAALGGLLNVHHHFTAPAAAPILLNLAIIIGVICFRKYFGDTPEQQIYVIAVSVLIAGVLQLAIQIPALAKAGISIRPRFHFSDAPLKKIFCLMAPMIIGLATVQINTLMDSLIALYLSSSPERGTTFTLLGYTINYPVIEGSVTYLFYAQRCYQFPLGLFGIALATAIFPTLSKYAVKKDIAGFSDTLAQGLRMVLYIGLPATAGMILVRTLLVHEIFEGRQFTAADTAQTSWTLLFYSLGIAFYCLQQLIVRAYYSFQDSVTPVKVAVRMVAVNFILNLTLIWFLATGGLALSTAISAALQVTILLIILTRRYQLKLTENLIPTLIKTILATAIMTLAGYATLHALNETSALIQLTFSVIACSISYVIASIILKIPEFKVLVSGSPKVNSDK
ncbi:MAG: murein biosynthesis integral membrane protein MurJ [Phycisphaerae bacterium]|nr:murein biosynthesis integral membrane protein MurJ [Phycisphaerae bacterium]